MRAAARLALGLAVLLAAGPVSAQTSNSASDGAVLGARYTDPTTRYAHGVLGDAIEWGGLVLSIDSCLKCALSRRIERQFTLPQTRVFEDTEPRVVDLPGSDEKIVVVVEAHLDQGARLALYGAQGMITATPYIGRRNRWLAPVGVGAADLDGDGALEIAYIDRPHLAKTLRIWRFEDGALKPLADLPGYTNHRIGEPDIAGGIRTCGGAPEMIMATADWSRVVAVGFDGTAFKVRDIGPHRGRESFAEALAC